MSELNDAERTRERMAALGRASGRARKKRGKRSLLDHLRARVERNPEALVEQLVEQLLASPAGAVKLASLLQDSGLLAADAQPKTIVVQSVIPADVAQVDGATHDDASRTRRSPVSLSPPT